MPNGSSPPPATRAAFPYAGNVGHYRRFIRWTAVACATGTATFLPLPSALRSAFAVTAIVGVVAVAAMSLAMRRDWPRPAHASRAGWLGVAFIVAAIAFDITATLHHSPTLDDEANPIAVALLDNGAPLAWVIGLGGVAQLALVLTLCMLWLNFMHRRGDYLRWLHAGDPRTPLWMRLFGMRTASLANVLLGRDGEPGVQVAAFGPYALAAAGYRFWLGLEWFGWVPLSRALVPVGCLLATFALVWCWVRRRLRGPGPAA